MATKINFYGKQVQAKIVNHVEKVLNWGRFKIEGETKRLIGKRAAKGTHSKSGRPPFRQTGRLINSIASEMIKKTTGIVARIGSTLKPERGQKYSYAFILEAFLKRPYLTTALRRWTSTIKQKLKMK